VEKISESTARINIFRQASAIAAPISYLEANGMRFFDDLLELNDIKPQLSIMNYLFEFFNAAKVPINAKSVIAVSAKTKSETTKRSTAKIAPRAFLTAENAFVKPR